MATQVVIRATESLNLHCNSVASQVEEKCCPYYRTLRLTLDTLLKALLLNKFVDSAHSEEWKQTLKEHEEKKDRVIEKYKGKCEQKKVE